jgi:hypothetical protein
MTLEAGVRLVQGAVVLLSVGTAHPKCPFYVSENMLFLTTLVGLAILQSAFTGFCPSAVLLRRLGLRSAGEAGPPSPAP